MSVFIPLIAIQISHPLITVSIHDFSRIVVSANWIDLLAFGGLVLPVIFCLAPIMLANNICDTEEDLRVRRYTLPVCVGIEKSLLLYRLLYIASYAAIIAVSLLRVVPLFTLALLLTCIPVSKNVRRFLERQDKRQTFFTSVLNFIIIAVPYAACIWLGVALSRLQLV
jgi:1,4-dihydroxy-2-naphthoate octaprenyltransferase